MADSLGPGVAIAAGAAFGIRLATDGDNQFGCRERALRMVMQMNEEHFGGCTNMQECEAVCPKRISIENIARMNRDYLKASVARRPDSGR